jgi:glycosyltransferase involved in cell wall biosynthesis
MKILFVVHCFFPDHIYGTETYTLRLAQNLQLLGREVVVLSAVFTGEPRREQLVTRYDFQGVPIICIDRNHLPSKSLEASFDLPALEPILEKIFLEERPDIIHVTQLMNHTAALPRVAHRLGIPTVATLTDFHTFCFNGRLQDAHGQLCSGPDQFAGNCLDCLRREARNHPWAVDLTPDRADVGGALTGLLFRLRSGGNKLAKLQRDLLKRKERLLAAYSEFRFVITPTAFLENAFRRLAPDWTYHRLHFGIDVDRAPKPLRSEGAPLTVGFIGQLTAHKGPDLLIEAIRQLSPLQNLRVCFYGSENQDPAFAERLRKSALGLPVEYCGVFPAEDIAAVLREIDVLVIPSRWHENSPLVLLNALATHTPVVISAAEGMTEFLREGENGYSFPIGDASELAAILQRFITDPALAARLSTTTSYELTSSHMTAQVDTLYRGLLTTNHP